jgi:hypothetical protein
VDSEPSQPVFSRWRKWTVVSMQSHLFPKIDLYSNELVITAAVSKRPRLNYQKLLCFGRSLFLFKPKLQKASPFYWVDQHETQFPPKKEKTVCKTV